MAMVNPAVLNLAAVSNAKDSRWLTLEVCREFQRSKCTRSDQECKFAHPPPHVEVQNGRVTACFDSIKGKCQRKEPPCKYLHPPQHLREQLLQNGRNNLILKNLQLQAAQQAVLSQTMVQGGMPIPISNSIQYSSPMPSYPRPRQEAGMNKTPAVALPPAVFNTGHYPSHLLAPHYLGGGMQTPTSCVAFNPYMNGGMATIAVQPQQQTNGESPSMLSQHPGIIPTMPNNAQQQSKLTRPDRLEVCREFQRGTCTRQPSECRYAHPPDNVTVDTAENCVTVCMDYIKGKCTRDSCRYFHPPPHLQAQIKACQQRANAAAAAQAQALSQIPGMMGQYKRVAVADAKGLPMYQPISNVSYQAAIAAMQFQQPQYIPGVSFAGHPPSMQRF